MLSTVSSHFQHVFDVTLYTSSSDFPLLFDVTLWMFLLKRWQNCWTFWSGMMVECLPSKTKIVEMSAFTNGIKLWRHFNQWHGHVQRQKKLIHSAQCNCAEKRTNHVVVLHLNHGRLRTVDLVGQEYLHILMLIKDGAPWQHLTTSSAVSVVQYKLSMPQCQVRPERQVILGLWGKSQRKCKQLQTDNTDPQRWFFRPFVWIP